MYIYKTFDHNLIEAAESKRSTDRPTMNKVRSANPVGCIFSFCIFRLLRIPYILVKPIHIESSMTFVQSILCSGYDGTVDKIWRRCINYKQPYITISEEVLYASYKQIYHIFIEFYQEQDSFR